MRLNIVPDSGIHLVCFSGEALAEQAPPHDACRKLVAHLRDAPGRGIDARVREEGEEGGGRSGSTR